MFCGNILMETVLLEENIGQSSYEWKI